MRRILLPGPGAMVALAVACVVSLCRLTSFDLFFNLAQARWILSNGFPAQDPFSFTAQGTWFPHEWGYGVLAEIMFRLFGGNGPALLSAVAIAAGILLIWYAVCKVYGRGGWLPVGLFLLALGAQAFSWDAQRAYLLGNMFFFVAVVLVVLYRGGKSWAIWPMIPLVAVWANVHGSWPAGVVLLAALACGMLVDARGFDRRVLLALLAAAVAFLAAAASPEGFRTCLYPFVYFAGGSASGTFDWHMLDLSSSEGWAVVLLMGALIFAVIRWPHRPVALLLPAFGLFAATVFAERFAPMAAAFLAVTCAELFSKAKPIPVGRMLAGALNRLDGWLQAYVSRAAGSLWPFVPVLAVAVLAAVHPVSLEGNMYAGHFPIASLRTLRTLPPGKVLSSYHLGGAVSAVAGPEYQVFIDGRNDLFPEQIHEDYRKMILLQTGWREALLKYAPDYLLISRVGPGGRLLEKLREAGGWRPMVEEASGELWVREGAWR